MILDKKNVSDSQYRRVSDNKEVRSNSSDNKPGDIPKYQTNTVDYAQSMKV